jgi:Holliday junction resolvase|tara:strand:+ start:6274 stop:6498 length:225 start_codon:yes stop_codon:yes gene_type:complete
MKTKNQKPKNQIEKLISFFNLFDSDLYNIYQKYFFEILNFLNFLENENKYLKIENEALKKQCSVFNQILKNQEN